VQQAETAQLHRSDSRTILLRKSVLVTNGQSTDTRDMVFVSLLIAPIVMAAAALTERRLGPSAAGWVAALPVSLAIAVAAVALDASARTATAMALSAGTHVPAQVLFAAAFAAVLPRHGPLLGGTAGTLAYVACAIALALLPDVAAIIAAVPLLALAPRMMTANPPRFSSPGRWSNTAMTCAAASVIVGVAVLTTRLAGPVAAGAVAAFPTMSATLAIAVITRDGPTAGAHVLAGLIRSLPCYLTFCLVVVLAAPSVGLPAIALALLGCVAAGRITWRAVPLPPQVVAAK
jgi:hypothetical protein